MGKTHPVFFSAVLLSTSTAKTCLLSPSSYPVCRRRKNGVCKLWWRWWWWSRHPFFSIIYSFKNFLFCKNLKKYSSAFSTQAVLVFWLVVLQNIPPTHTHSAGWKFSIFYLVLVLHHNNNTVHLHPLLAWLGPHHHCYQSYHYTLMLCYYYDFSSISISTAAGFWLLAEMKKISTSQGFFLVMYHF